MVETATRIYCVMEYLAGGELYDHLYYSGKKKKPAPIEKKEEPYPLEHRCWVERVAGYPLPCAFSVAF
jgi:hypothetical protein